MKSFKIESAYSYNPVPLFKKTPHRVRVVLDMDEKIWNKFFESHLNIYEEECDAMDNEHNRKNKAVE